MSHGKNISCQRFCAHQQRPGRISAAHGREVGNHDSAHRTGSHKREDSHNPSRVDRVGWRPLADRAVWVGQLGAQSARGRLGERVSAVELSTQEAAPILKKSLAGAPSFVTNYFDVTPDSPLADFEREAPRHPVFRLNTLS
jgi:hypothetical protein